MITGYIRCYDINLRTYIISIALKSYDVLLKLIVALKWNH